MTLLTWDEVDKRLYETGVDHGVLYKPDESGDYGDGVAWNGLETVTESPTGAEATPTYADNIKYLNLISLEQFEATIEAYTYPDEFAECDGLAELSPGVNAGQQNRVTFGLCYRTLIGDAVVGTDHGYKLHMVYGLTAAPSEKAYGTVNDSPEAITFSWQVSSIPVAVSGRKPSSIVTLDSTKVDPTVLANLLNILYGSAADPRMPLPDELASMFEGTVTVVDLGVFAKQPSYNAATHVVTIPTVTGVNWTINGAEASPGAQPAMTAGQVSLVEAHAAPTYSITGDDEWTFDY